AWKQSPLRAVLIAPDFLPDWGAMLALTKNLEPLSSWSSNESSVRMVLSVVHFSLRVQPQSRNRYLVSNWAFTRPVSLTETPLTANSTLFLVLVLTSSFTRPVSERDKTRQKNW